ncbi:MAG: glycerol kinase [Parasphingorhabdus sp.]|jgi:glycerol kinase
MQHSGVFIGIDHGGTTTTALVLDIEQGKLSSHSVPMPKRMPRLGYVEHDPEEFFESSLAAAKGALDSAKLKWSDVQGIGIANQGETSMAWDAKTGIGIGPAISWEDKRTSDICDQLASKGVDRLIRNRTGIMLDPYFSASKFKWLIDNIPEIAAARDQGTLRLGGTDSYVINRLTEGAIHATEAGTASRTALFSLYKLAWDSDLLNAFDLKHSQLPSIRPSCGDFGIARHESFNGASVPITANIVDAHGALIAQGCRDNTVAKATFGTGAFIEVNTGRSPLIPDGIFPVFVAWDLESIVDYTIEGSVFSVGSAIDWFVRSGLLPSPEASAAMALSVADSAGVSVVPCFTGLSAPYWKSNARASITGLGLDSTSAHIVRALLDGIAFQCAEIIQSLNEKTQGAICEVRADGGPTKNRFLMQRLADLLGMPVSVSQEPDMTALGTAYLAAMGAGQLKLDDLSAMERKFEIFEPIMDIDEREMLWTVWHKNVREVCKKIG